MRSAFFTVWAHSEYGIHASFLSFFFGSQDLQYCHDLTGHEGLGIVQNNPSFVVDLLKKQLLHVLLIVHYLSFETVHDGQPFFLSLIFASLVNQTLFFSPGIQSFCLLGDL